MFGFAYPQNATAAFDGTIWNNAATFASDVSNSRVTHHTYYSASMQRTIGYSVYLPTEYDSGTDRYNVIYAFSAGGTENSICDQYLTHYNAAHPVIVVFGNFGVQTKLRDAIVGAPMYGVMMMETAFINELMPLIDGHYRTIAEKRGRALTGFSRGAQGGLRFLFKYPQLFSSFYGYAPAIVAAADSQSSSAVTSMYGGDSTAFDNDRAQALATANAANIIAQAPAIHFVVGQDDTTNSPTTLLQLNRDLDTQLTSLGIAHDALVEKAGVGHDLTGLWSAEGGHLDLDFLWSHFS